MRRLLGIAALCTLGCGSLPAPRPFAASFPEYTEGARFAVVGDTQRTMLIEAWREQNDAERLVVAEAIARARPAFVVMTGDQVADGSSERKWVRFEQLYASVRDAGITVLAAFGNHDYWGGRDGDEKLFARFPGDERRHWFSRAFGPLGLVVLDSNEGVLEAAEWQEQLAFYRRTLGAFDADAAIRGVLVFLHHPPYTNSTVTGDEAHVQRFLVPPFLASKKTLAMLSGHVHSYERFVRDGRTFVVSGGGGGPRAPLNLGRTRRHRDDRYAGPALRPFHFTLYTLHDAGIEAEVLGVEKGKRELFVMDRFELPFRGD